MPRRKRYDGNVGIPCPLRALLESWPLPCACPLSRQPVSLPSWSKSHLGPPASLQGESRLFSVLRPVFQGAAEQRKLENPKKVDCTSVKPGGSPENPGTYPSTAD